MIIENEVFIDLPNYEGKYQISNLGKIKFKSWMFDNKERLLHPVINKNGYYWIYLTIRGKSKRHKIHELVASVFIDSNYKPSSRKIVDHINSIKTDNCSRNLQIITLRRKELNRLKKIKDFKGL